MTKKEKIKIRKTIFGVLLATTLVIAMTTTTILMNMRENPNPDNPMEWIKAPLVLATNNTVGAGTAGIVDIYILNDAFTGWNNPIDEDDSNIYEETDGTFTDSDPGAPHEALTGTTPYETDYHVCVVYQFTDSMAKDGGTWNASRVKAYFNSSGCQDGDADSVLMSEGSWYSGDDAATQRINFYLLDIDGGADDGTAFQHAIDSTVSYNCTIYYYG